MLENRTDSILVISDDGIIRYANQAAEALFQRKRGKLVGQFFGIPAIYDETIEVDIVSSNLQLTSTDMRAVKIEFEDSFSVMVTLTDITKRQNSVSAQQESAACFRSIFENLDDGIVIIDEQGTIKSISPAAEQIFDYTAQELLGECISSLVLVGGNKSKQHDTWLSAHLKSDGNEGIEKEPCELIGIRKNGERFPIELSVYEMQLRERKEFVGVIVDITDRKESEKQLFQLQKMEAVGQLTSGVAHDFNNILGVALGNMELLYESLPNDNEMKAYVNSAMEAITHGAGLTKQLLAFSRRKEFEHEVLKVNKLIIEMSEMLRLTLGEGIRVNTKLSGNLDLIKVDPVQLESVILNLSINSRDAMNGNGSLLIETSNVDFGSDHAGNRPCTGVRSHVCISVTDTGIGMSEDVLGKIFQPFFTTKEVGKGTGLGLSMVSSFVKQSHGHIEVSSEMGFGTQIRIYLPACDQGEASVDSRASESWAPFIGQGKTVLLVKDEEPIQETTASMLENIGFTVLCAADGSSALVMLRNSPTVDLLLTDMVIPGGISGHELALKVREELPNLPVVIASGYSREAPRDGHIFPLLKKPYTKQDLRLILSQIFDSKRQIPKGVLYKHSQLKHETKQESKWS